MSLALATLSQRWNEKLRLGDKHKKRVYGKYAKDAMRFYSEPHDFLYNEAHESREGGPYSGFKATVNLVANMVQVFLAFVYHQNHTRTFTPRRPAVPADLLAAYSYYKQAQQGIPVQPQPPSNLPTPIQVNDQLRSQLLEAVLNITPEELNLKGNSRESVTEGLVKGRGVLWTEMRQCAYGWMPGSTYVSSDDLGVDPDARRLVDAKWIYRRRRLPVREVEILFGLEKGSLKGDDYSAEMQAELNTDDESVYENQTGSTADLLTYYEVYSRIGLGTKLKGAMRTENGEQVSLEVETALQPAMIQALETIGDNVFLAIAPGVKYPLNMPEAMFDAQDENLFERLYQATRWPIPYHDDHADPWPFSELDFHLIPGCPWPMAHIFPALGFVKAIDWIFSYMMGRIKICSRTFMLTPKGLADDIKERILYGNDLELLDIEESHPGTVENVVKFLQMPDVTKDIWNVLQQLRKEYEDATGMTPLLMGYTPQGMRSAQEATIKQGNANMRPEDMANTVDDWQSRVCRKEAIAWRLMGDPAIVARMFGEPYNPEGQQTEYGVVPIIGPMTQAWMELVHTEDVASALSDTEYRVESGSARKPNMEAKIQNVDQGINLFGPLYSQLYTGTGNSGPINSLASQWAKLHGMDPMAMMLPDMTQQMQMQAQAGQAPQELEQQGEAA